MSGFTEEERAAMQARAEELKKEAKRGAKGDRSAGERDLLEKVGEM